MKSLLLLTLCALLKYTEAACYSGSNPVLCGDSSCSGSCTGENGCLCLDGTTCMPVSTECPMDDNSCCENVPGWYWDRDLACCTETPQCNAPACGSDEVCTAINNQATCVCNNSTYLGIKPLDVKPTVTCTTVMTASVSLCQLEQLGYNYSSLVLANHDDACAFPHPDIINNTRVQSIQVKPAIGWCGNIVSNDSSKIYFINTAYIYPNSGPLITKNPIVFNFSCGYNLNMNTSLSFSLKPISSTIIIPSPNPGTADFSVTMAAYSNVEFNDPIQEDDVILVGSNIYLGLFSPNLDADAFALRAENCFATPTNNSDDSLNVKFVSGGCPVSDDIATAVIQNGNSSEARIQTSAFLFQASDDVYIFCDVTICDKKTQCEGCKSQRAARGSSSQLSIRLTLQDFDYVNTSSGDHAVASWAMLAASLLGLLSVKFF